MKLPSKMRPVAPSDLDSMELTASDLLDIDGSDDATVAYTRKLPFFGPKNLRSPFARRTRGNKDDDQRKTHPLPMKVVILPDPAPPTPAPAMANPPGARRARNVNESYPPVAVAKEPRTAAYSYFQERPSRAGWVAAALIALILVIAGSSRMHAAPAVAAANVSTDTASPALVAEPAAPSPTVELDSIVKFGDEQAVSIKASPKGSASAVAAKPAPKPVATLSLSNSKPTPSAAPAATPTAKPRKLSQIEQELADAQLKAAQR